jgi:hypothetical protein
MLKIIVTITTTMKKEISILFMPTIVNLLELLFYAFRVLDISRKINALGSLRR